MKNWCMLFEIFSLIFYCIYQLNRGDIELEYVVVGVLVYAIIKLTYYIISKKEYKKICLVICICFLISMYYFLDKNIIMFLPINLYSLLYYYRNKDIYSIITTIISVLAIENNIRIEYLFFAGITFIIVELYNRNINRIDRLEKELDYIRERNYKLNKLMNNNKQYEVELKRVSQIEERNKIAQQIHDNIGHTLAGSIMQLEAIKLLLRKDIDKSEDMLDNTVNVLRRGMESIRLTLREIKPSSEEVGIRNLKHLVSTFKRNNDIEVSLLYDNNIDLINTKQWQVIVQNTKEALTNAIKYSNASLISINIKILNKIIKVKIEDNGVGNDKIVKGLGIIGMEERVEKINGKLIIDGSNGFSTIMLIPIEHK